MTVGGWQRLSKRKGKFCKIYEAFSVAWLQSLKLGRLKVLLWHFKIYSIHPALREKSRWTQYKSRIDVKFGLNFVKENFQICLFSPMSNKGSANLHKRWLVHDG